MAKRKYSQEEGDPAMSGRIYINREDARIFVRKRGLYAWTMNLGNPCQGYYGAGIARRLADHGVS